MKFAIYLTALSVVILTNQYQALWLVNSVGLIAFLVHRKKRRERGTPRWRDTPVMVLPLGCLGYLAYVVAASIIIGDEKGVEGILFFAVSFLVVAALVGFLGFRKIPGDRVGIVRRRYGRTHPKFRNVTPYKTRGVLARPLLPGRSGWVAPFFNEVQFLPRMHVAEGKVGLVTATEGEIRPSSRPLGISVACDNFQDGETFLLNGGEQGRQVDTLAGGQSYYLNPRLFEVEQVERVYVAPGTIGLVNAKAGAVRPPARSFGPHVECDDFQDGSRFISGGGHQGRQLAILQGGAYYNINPALFEVVTVDNVAEVGGGEISAHHLREISIPIGYVGVVIALDGTEPESPDQLGPRVEGHQGFRLPWVFLQNGGYRGVQEETLPEGTVCALNPYFVRVMLIPTRVLVLEWSEKTPAKSTNYDAQLGRIAVTVQGHRLFVDMSQTLQVPQETAPKLVSMHGGTQTSGLGGLDYDPRPVQRFVERVLGAIVVSYFNEIAAAATVKEFLETYAETRTDLASQVRGALHAWGVEARNTTLGEFIAEDPFLNEALKRPAHEQMRSDLLDVELANAEREDAIDVVRLRKETRRMSLELKSRIETLGLNNVVVLEMLKEITKAPVPQFIGGGDLTAYLDTQPLARLEEILGKMKELQTGVEVQAPPRPRAEVDSPQPSDD